MTSVGSVLVVEPYFGGSHRAWAEGMRDHLRLSVELLTLPARWWKWRMRGAAVTLAQRCAELSFRPDVVVVSDMLDVAAFRTFARPHLGDTPVVVYFHETQLTYPDSPQMAPDLHFAFTNWTSALAADRVFFNSDYHHDVFFAEIGKLLRHFPDFTHEHLVEQVRERSEVLEVGVDLSWIPTDVSPRSGPVRLIWNHRWEHDKDPVAFFDAMYRLAAEGLEFELVVCGENFRQQPDEFAAAARRIDDRIVHMGYLETDDYRRHLLEADVVVSTSLQEFFGVAVVEAMASGCFPVLPQRLSYPGLVPTEFHDLCLYGLGELVENLRWVIENPAEVRETAGRIAPAARRYSWEEMAPRYRRALSSVAAQGWMA